MGYYALTKLINCVCLYRYFTPAAESARVRAPHKASEFVVCCVLFKSVSRRRGSVSVVPGQIWVGVGLTRSSDRPYFSLLFPFAVLVHGFLEVWLIVHDLRSIASMTKLSCIS